MNALKMTLSLHRCSIMCISIKCNTVSTKYTINDFPLNRVSGVKYLGVSISSKISCSNRIHDICTKERKSLGFICRNLCNCPQYVQDQAYSSLERPMLEYACCVWDSYQRMHIKQLESTQHHAALFTTGNYHSMNPGCVTNMVTQLGWDLLEH